VIWTELAQLVLDALGFENLAGWMTPVLPASSRSQTAILRLKDVDQFERLGSTTLATAAALDRVVSGFVGVQGHLGGRMLSSSDRIP
jgi:hypothetical protein